VADNVSITEGSGKTIAADDISSVWFQRVKMAAGGDGVHTGDVGGRQVSAATDVALYVDPRPYLSVFTITPTIDTNAYTSGDCLGGVQTISNAARYTGGGGFIRSVTVLDKTQAQRAAIDLLFYSATITDAGNNAPFAPTDADSALYVGEIRILTGDYNTAWPGTPLNSVAYKPNSGTATFPLSMEIPYSCATTSLFMQAVVRGTPTYTSTTDIVIKLHCHLF
jgi:hypothetical protein